MMDEGLVEAEVVDLMVYDAKAVADPPHPKGGTYGTLRRTPQGCGRRSTCPPELRAVDRSDGIETVPEREEQMRSRNGGRW